MSDPDQDLTSVNTSYGVCQACGCLVHHDQDFCPECDAQAGETVPGSRGGSGSFVFPFMLILLLAGALALLSLDREQARQEEQARFAHIPSVPGPERTGPEIPETVAQDKPFTPLETQEPTSTPEPEVAATAPVPSPFTMEMEEEEIEEDFAVTSPPEADPEPTVPEPEVEEPRESRQANRRAELKAQYLAELDEEHPMYEVGDEVELTWSNGRQIRGTIQRFTPQEVLLETRVGIQGIPYRLLDPRSRIRVDELGRRNWAEERAIADILEQPTP